MGLSTADLEVLRDRDRTQVALDCVSCTTAGFFCDSSHQVAFRRRSMGADEDNFFVGLYNFKDSACLVWPVRLAQVPEDPSMYYIEWKPISRPQVLAVCNISHFEGFSFEWKAWSWQVRTFGKAVSLRPAVRAFKVGAIGNLEVLAAKAAWWALPRSVLETVGESLGIDLSGSTSLFDLVFRLTKGVLGGSDESIFELLEKRMQLLARTSSNMEDTMEDIMAVDEAAQCLREEDRADIEVEKKKAHETVGEEQKFRATFRERRSSARPSTGKAMKGVLSKYTGPKKLPTNFEHLAQGEIKRFLPPDAFLWRARGSNSWNSRYKQFPVRSCRGSAWGGELYALLQCLRSAWSWWADCDGVPQAQCPLQNLWDEAFNPSGEAASSSTT